MNQHLNTRTEWSGATELPMQLDCETQALLRLFLNPILETSANWAEIAQRLREKGYDYDFVEGRMVILNDMAKPLCTGRDLGVPLAEITQRIGAPNQ
ncbi:MAG: hypothetical protein N4A70_17760 [Pelagimonas sp.]|jgi:hypothetical protein|nr:hypothetical protein [Pelagimonas sp.]